MEIWVTRLKRLRIISMLLGLSNLAVIIIGGFVLFIVIPGCDHNKIIMPVLAVSLAAILRIFVMIRSGIAQEAMAKIIQDSLSEPSIFESIIRLKRRIRYKAWLWWNRFAMIITLLQIMGGIYLVLNIAKYASQDGTSNQCLIGMTSNGNQWKQKLFIVFIIMVCSIPLVQCFAGPDVLKWRSFYATKDDVWKAHYHEVFDHGIREALCCLGRVEYLGVSKEDEVCSVARLLGDLVAYRASGTGHLELIAGVALLHMNSGSTKSYEGVKMAPRELIQEAFDFFEYAEAAYTGPLLDFGRHNILFPCSWLYRQGILTPWTRNRRPILTGDNWWRGHAAAFLKYVDLPPETLRHGRVCQEKCEAAYFIVVLHHLRSVVVAVRGTETPEDLITDGLGRECLLSQEDLDGLINSKHVHPNVKQNVELSFPHYGHLGIVEAARDLYMQIEGNLEDQEAKSSGFLSSLLGAGCECDGYNIYVVGHSLGGAIATLLGLRLHGKYPKLRVYAYGPLPCVDSVIAEACSEFVTSIVHDNEFSTRLSVGSIIRLRAAALMALSEDSNTDTTLIFRLARRFLYISKCQRGIEVKNPSESHPPPAKVEDLHHEVYKGRNKLEDGYSFWKESDINSSSNDGDVDVNDDNFQNPFHKEARVENSLDNPVSQFLETVPGNKNGSAEDPPDVFLPGLVIHLLPEQSNTNVSLWKSWRFNEKPHKYNAYMANREDFKDIVVSPNMFLDHLPWRCRYALQKILEAENAKELLDEAQIV